MLQRSIWLGILVLSLLAGRPLSAGVLGSQDEDTSLRNYYSANGLANRGLPELAVAEYRKFLEHHEEHEKALSARYGLAVCLYRLERYDEAVSELTLLRRQPDGLYAAEVATILAQCQLARKQYAQAAELFDEVVRRYDTHNLADDAAAGAAEALYLDKRYADVIVRCRVLTSRWPQSPLRERTQFLGGLAAMGQHHYQDAADRFTNLLADFPNGPFTDQASLFVARCYHQDGLIEQAVRQYRALLKRTATEYIPDALLGLGMLALQQDRALESGKLLDQLIAEYADGPLVATARFYRGRSWFELDEWDRAMSLFQQSAAELKEGPLEDNTVYWTAKCRLRQGHFHDAAARLDAAIDAFPESELLAEMHYDRAVALVRGDKPDQGIEALQQFRKRFPKHVLDSNALHLLATTEHDQRCYDQSQFWCREFLETHPSHELTPTIAFLSAENDILSGHDEEAVGAYRRFLTRYSDSPHSAGARYRLGSALYRLGQYDEAQTLLAEFVEQAQSNERFRFALLALGDIHFQRSEWKQAERFLDGYLSAGPGAAAADDALLKLGLVFQRQGNNQEALSAFDRLIQQFPDSPHRLQAVFERGQVLVALDRYDDAAPAFEQVLAEGGESRFKPYVLDHLASLAMRRKDFSTAAGLYQDAGGANGLDEAGSLLKRGQAWLAAGQFGEAETAFAELLDRYPSHETAARAHAQLAIALSRQNRCAEVLKVVEQVEPKLAGKLNPTMRASMRFEKAWCLRKLERVDEAARTYRDLLAGESPEDVHIFALLDLASIEVKANRYEPAAKLLKELRKSIANASMAVPDDVRAQQTYQLAVCEFELGRFSTAAGLFEEFIARFADSRLLASASFFCGECLYELDKHAAAVVHLTRVVDDFPSDPVHAPALLRLGECHSVLQHWPKAEQMFNEYLHRHSGSDQWFQAQFGIGWARENQGRYNEAIGAYRKVAERHQGPTAARAQFQIGECLFAKKEYEQAASELLKVDILYAYPEWSAAALYEAGQCFEKLSKYVEARGQFKAVTETFPDTRWAQLASKRMAELAAGSLPGRQPPMIDRVGTKPREEMNP